jgi:hypothetical protein
VVQGKGYGPFNAKLDKGGKPIRVFPFQLVVKNGSQPAQNFAIALELDPKTTIGADWPLAHADHDDKHQVHFLVELEESGFFMQGQLITHK